MIIRILTTGTNLNITPQVARVIRVYNYRVPSGITESIFTAAGQVLGATAASTPVAVSAPTVEGQIPVARLGSAAKWGWESVDLSQLIQTAIKTAAYTAAANDHVLVDNSGASGNFAIKLPPSPSGGDKVRVTLVDTTGAYDVTIDRNGSLVMGATSTSAYSLSTIGGSVYFEYTGADLGWLALYDEGRLVDFDYLIVAGGGGGGASNGAGGGAGGVVTGEYPFDLNTDYACVVGAGGAGGGTNGHGSDGNNSSVAGLTAAVGGGGGGYASGQNGNNGGSGGGASSGGTKGSGTAGQGYDGGQPGGAEGGGGGASEAGETDGAGYGGDGLTWSIDGQKYGGGGAGWAAASGGGEGGGGNPSTNGTANTGGGGGAWNGAGTAGAGGSGVIKFRYPDTYTITIGAGLTGSEGAPSGGYKIATLTAGSGNVSWS